ncbi:MAG: hypothetical protein KKB20_19040 [Proteobacteria bacterium]|nr:hypothetical protein [Pseudomonadota bacterium]
MCQAWGYAGSILKVDLSTGEIETVSTATYADRFLGGRGIAAKIHLDEVPAEITAFDPENRLVFMTGPICGLPGFAGSRWQVSAKSPFDDRFSYCNLGGSWGAQLKFAGYDGLVVRGRADRPVCLVIDDASVAVKDAADISGRGAIETRTLIKADLGRDFRVAAVGPAGENLVHNATLTADLDSSGSSGLGAVMGSKNLKAVAVRGSGRPEPADKALTADLRKAVRSLKHAHPDWPTMLSRDRIKKEVCFGCIDGCIRQAFTDEEGRTGKYTCQSAAFYEVRAYRYYGRVTEVPFQANKLCDDYGLDTRAVETMIMWLSRCFKAGLLNEAETGLPLSHLGSLEFIEALLRKVSFREGFGDVLAQGTLRAAQTLGRGSDRLITDYMIRTGENEIYGPRLYITTGLFYAMEPRMPIQQLHEVSELGMLWAARETGGKGSFIALPDNYMTSEVIRRIADRFWGSEVAADFSTDEGKALAAVRIQDREYVKESMILCDLSWPIMHSPATSDHLGDPDIEARIYSAVTGREMDPAGLARIGERIFNLQRAVLVREGQRGRTHDTLDEFNFTAPLRGDVGNPECLVPGPDGRPFSRQGAMVDRAAFERLKDEFYRLRGWDLETGLQTRAGLAGLDLSDTADLLDREGLLAGQARPEVPASGS